ncbi:LapA family protein [Coleofasciculus sp. FACHB-64]|uniref:LapA family protein n=1 Tax=Cyanophyceae TaxID=3028117 RepID=UPI0016881A52|nr:MULTISPECIES: LapA family protein [unclassified Coleofasciculus]MBD1841319.1 LapA family protein [Coleofasciculus sp. FACHB-501]MBD1878948.1 LapA family protein [Coleofasciculus sp. FACHB-T130]MBD1901488.1 LapA family protein [Coleofasciculus sp. FACHB-125]MBD1941767.1 LapA family protein [Coleofasciculus sp. FACHB-712]MBD2047889.1 LapA family protein [Coleofasciculus sp. FACHB-64]
MRQINFLLIFAVLLALVLFSLENTEPAAIQIVQGVEVQAPLCIELILAMGLGAVLAWIFSIWARLLRSLESGKQLRQMRAKDERIQELEENIEHYKAEIEERQSLPLNATLQTENTEVVGGKLASLAAAKEQESLA